MEKTYWAAVDGELDGAGVWEDWLRKLPDESRAELAEPDAPGAKSAVLHWRALRALPNGRTLVELKPTTGRMHQLRVQSAARGVPIAGDDLYGSRSAFGPPGEVRAKVIALHARSLAFFHPTATRQAERVVAVAPLPPLWAQELGVPAGELEA